MYKEVHSTITNPGTPFVLGEKVKNKTFLPGSEGYLSYVLGPDHSNPNIVFHKAIITRRGKNGKTRMDSGVFLSPIFVLPESCNELMAEKEEKKHFVDLIVNTENPVMYNLSSNQTLDDLSFVASILARGLFVKTLDKVLYKDDNLIVQKIGLREFKEVYIWPKKKSDSLLKKLVEEVQNMFIPEDLTPIGHHFCSKVVRTNIMEELKLLESFLVIPKLEYQRQTDIMSLAALDYINKKLKAEKGGHHQALIKQLKGMKTCFSANKYKVTKLLEHKLDSILKNRKLL